MQRTVSPTPTPEECSARISRALRRHIGDTRDKRKVFARAVGVDHRTFEGYLYGSRSPLIDKLVVLMAEVPSLCDELMALVEEVRKIREGNNK